MRFVQCREMACNLSSEIKRSSDKVIKQNEYKITERVLPTIIDNIKYYPSWIEILPPGTPKGVIVIIKIPILYIRRIFYVDIKDFVCSYNNNMLILINMACFLVKIHGNIKLQP